MWDLRYIDAPIYRDERKAFETNTFDELLYYTTDANMNVTALVNASDGSVEERYHYDAYGQVSFYDKDWNTRSVSAENNRILFAGYIYDEETGLYKARNRDLHSLLGRWINRDPAGYVDGLNLYQYVMSNPTGYVDPFGMKTVKELQEELDELDKTISSEHKAMKRAYRVAEIVRANAVAHMEQYFRKGELSDEERMTHHAEALKDYALMRELIMKGHASSALEMEAAREWVKVNAALTKAKEKECPVPDTCPDGVWSSVGIKGSASAQLGLGGIAGVAMYRCDSAPRLKAILWYFGGHAGIAANVGAGISLNDLRTISGATKVSDLSGKVVVDRLSYLQISGELEGTGGSLGVSGSGRPGDEYTVSGSMSIFSVKGEISQKLKKGETPDLKAGVSKSTGVKAELINTTTAWARFPRQVR